MTLTRRSWIGGLCTAASVVNGVANGRLAVDRLLDRFSTCKWKQENRLYRVDAAVTVLASPMHWFRGIGEGFLTLGETPDAAATFLRFGAASRPEKAHGFDRLGFIEEAAAGAEFASFGFITAGPESHSNSEDASYTAMDLYAHGQQCWFRRAGVPMDERSRRDLNWLIRAVREAMPGASGVNRQVQLCGPHPTFLHALLRAVLEPAGQFGCTYVYNAKQFDLTVERREDPRMASLLASKGLTQNPGAIGRYEGLIRDGAGQSSGRQWSFRFWREDSGGAARLPLRVEFQPKPMLRLSLEWVQMRTT